MSSSTSSSKFSQTLSDLLPGLVALKGSDAYETAQNEYWTTSQKDLSPAFRVSPSTPQHVSTIITTAIQHDCKFAIHSGGHRMSRGDSNIGEEGFTIDTRGIDTFELSENGDRVKLGTGLRWGSAFQRLSEKGLTVVGGRDPDVGIGGFLLNGGVSLLSYQHGLGADNVIEYEIVTASGDIVYASEDKNADLWWALKLGSTNYGIITAYTVKTYPIAPAFWGGLRFYSLEDAEIITSRFSEMATKANGDPTTGITDMVYAGVGGNAQFMLMLGFQTDKPEPELYKTLAGGLKPTMDTTKQGTQMEYINGNKFPGGRRTKLYVRNMRVDGSFLKEDYEKGKEIWSSSEVANISGLQWTASAQPWTENYYQPNSPIYSKAVKGETQMLISNQAFWDNAEDDEVVERHLATWVEWFEKKSAERGILRDFLYANYIDVAQPLYEGSVSSSDLAKMRAVQAKYDPKLAFQKLVPGGFKLPA